MPGGVLIQKAARGFRQNTWERQHIHTPVFINLKKKLKEQENVTYFPFLRKRTLNELG